MAFTPNFAPSIRLFDILALTILLLPIATVPSLVLDSKRVNRQRRHLTIWIIALLVNIVANVVVLRAGWGSQAIAINDAWVQFLVVVTIFETAARHIWEGDARRRGALYVKMALVLAVAVAVTVTLDMGVSGLHPGRLDGAAILLRCGGTVVVWAIVTVLLLRPGSNATE